MQFREQSTKGRGATLDARAIESAVSRGDSALVLQSYASLVDEPGLTPEVAFALGRAFKEEEQFAAAEQLFLRAMSTSGPQTLGRIEAHLAHLDYYRGDFVYGAERALRVSRAGTGVAHVEGALYASVNLIALNRSSDALARAIEARNSAQRLRDKVLRQDVTFRVLRQLVHVYIARGDYRAAESVAQEASVISRRIDSPHHRGFSAYLRGYVAWARGDPGALILFREADREWGGTDHAFGRWLQYIWAMTLRDLGHVGAAMNLHAASGVRLSWEEPLFEASEGREPRLPSLEPCPRDELPFRRGTRGLLLLLRGRFRAAEEDLVNASAEFGRYDLHHYRRGAALTLAAARLAAGATRSAAAILRSESPDLARLAIQRWPWWHPEVARRLAVFALEIGTAVSYWRQFVRPKAVVPTNEDVLRAFGLTEREVEVTLTWLQHTHWSRPRLAAHLGISEASLRNHVNSLRRKLGCGLRRGPSALRDRIDELAARRARAPG